MRGRWRVANGGVLGPFHKFMLLGYMRLPELIKIQFSDFKSAIQLCMLDLFFKMMTMERSPNYND